MATSDPFDFDQALQEHLPLLRLWAQLQVDRYLRQQFDFSGVIQETLLDALQDREKFTYGGQAEFGKWIRTIHRHNVIDEIRKRTGPKRMISIDQIEVDTGLSCECLAGMLEANQTSPSQKVVKQEDLLHLARTFERLGENQRNAVRLKDLSGWSLKEVAGQLGIGQEAVAGLLHRGRTTLRKMMTEDAESSHG
jgi:RNA polymerase sigma-70 factor (subfamily 1)